MSSEDIIIIGANEFQKPIVQKAKQMGYKTHVFARVSGVVCKEIGYHVDGKVFGSE